MEKSAKKKKKQHFTENTLGLWKYKEMFNFMSVQKTTFQDHTQWDDFIRIQLATN